ncbi:hypothetical protein VTK73DRAFT_9234 [Phialemonium thermophilum]|uniref:Uncharacterized protein n=1 Tax=Phialemonium thermophilum TaxID=223376 RepID=A0ABR3W3P9_9PEZI
MCASHLLVASSCVFPALPGRPRQDSILLLDPHSNTYQLTLDAPVAGCEATPRPVLVSIRGDGEYCSVVVLVCGGPVMKSELSRIPWLKLRHASLFSRHTLSSKKRNSIQIQHVPS